MRYALLTSLIFGFGLASAAPALAMNKDQAIAECRAIHGGQQGRIAAERTGGTNPAMAKCVKAKMSGKKK